MKQHYFFSGHFISPFPFISSPLYILPAIIPWLHNQYPEIHEQHKLNCTSFSFNPFWFQLSFWTSIYSLNTFGSSIYFHNSVANYWLLAFLLTKHHFSHTQQKLQPPEVMVPPGHQFKPWNVFPFTEHQNITLNPEAPDLETFLNFLSSVSTRSADIWFYSPLPRLSRQPDFFLLHIQK